MNNIKLDKKFYKTLMVIGIPVMFQNLLSTALNLIDTLMIGQVGKNELAGVGLANQLFFVMILLIFGINSGASVFIAQFWGRKDVVNIKKTMGIGLIFGTIISFIFFVLAQFFPEQIMGLLSDQDPNLIKHGTVYLKVVSWSYMFTAISFSFSVAARSIAQATTPTVISAIAVFINATLNYGLIYGNFGLPEMGVAGAALATVIARVFELTALLSILYSQRSPLAAKLSELFNFDLNYLKTVMGTSFPVIVNESMWAVGNVMYTIAIAKISADAVASYQVGVSVYRFYEVVFIGLASACQVMIGNSIGAGLEGQAKAYAKRFMILNQLAAVAIVILLVLTANWSVRFFGLPPEVTLSATNLVKIYGIFSFFKCFNLLMIVGVLRGGGDTQYAMKTELAAVWLIGVPAAFIAAVLLKWPVEWTVALMMLEEVAKSIFCLLRYLQGKWCKNVISDFQTH